MPTAYCEMLKAAIQMYQQNPDAGCRAAGVNLRDHLEDDLITYEPGSTGDYGEASFGNHSYLSVTERAFLEGIEEVFGTVGHEETHHWWWDEPQAFSFEFECRYAWEAEYGPMENWQPSDGDDGETPEL